jgi:hypothetical protein
VISGAFNNKSVHFVGVIIVWSLFNLQQFYVLTTQCVPGQPESWGSPGLANNLAPHSKTMLFTLFFGLEQDWWGFLRARAQISDKFRRYYFAHCNLCLLAPHLRLFQLRRSASLARRVAARLDRPEDRLWANLCFVACRSQDKVSDPHLPCHAMPCPALIMPFFSRPRHSTAVQRRPVGYLPAFGFFRLPRGVPRSLLSEAYHSQMQVASVKPNNVCHGRGKEW